MHGFCGDTELGQVRWAAAAGRVNPFEALLSPSLFNTVLQDAFGKWKERLTNDRISIANGAEVPRLTNIRYANDLLIFGKSQAEAIEILDSLVAVLVEYGLAVHAR